MAAADALAPRGELPVLDLQRIAVCRASGNRFAEGQDLVDDPKPDLLQEFLRGQDTPCPACGYNLRELTGSRCPECGEVLALQVGAVEPRLDASIAGLIGLAAGTGFNGLFLFAVLIYDLVMRHGWDGDRHLLVILGLGFFAIGWAMAIWLRFWRKIRRLSPTQRWLLVGAGWLLTIADIVVFAISVN